MRPHRLVLVLGTGTDVGKTWISARLLHDLRRAGVTVAARKPAQSFDPADDPAWLDSALLAASTGESPETVCRRSRWYPVAMAPPMAAEVLGQGRFTMNELLEELSWPEPRVQVGLVEAAGGVRSPQTHDGDAVALLGALAPDIVLLVADAGLGALNAVRLSMSALPGTEGKQGTERTKVVVVLNRFDHCDDLHVRNRRWLTEQDGMCVIGMPGDEPALATLVRGY